MTTETAWSKALEYLDTNGWRQGTVYGLRVDDNGKRDHCTCIGGALAAVVTGNTYDVYSAAYPPHGSPSEVYELTAILSLLLQKVGGEVNPKLDGFLPKDNLWRVFAWNDDQSRTYEDIRRVLMELHQTSLNPNGEDRG